MNHRYLFSKKTHSNYENVLFTSSSKIIKSEVDCGNKSALATKKNGLLVGMLMVLND